MSEKKTLAVLRSLGNSVILGSLLSVNYSVRLRLVKNEFCPILTKKKKKMQQAASRTNSCCNRAVHGTNTARETNQYCNHQCNQSNETPGSINTVSSQMTTV